MEKPTDAMLAEIQALLDEDDDEAVLPETDDAPIRGVPTVHRSTLNAPMDAEGADTPLAPDVRSQLIQPVRSSRHHLRNSGRTLGHWAIRTCLGLQSYHYIPGVKGQECIERQFANTPEGPWLALPTPETRYCRDRGEDGMWKPTREMNADTVAAFLYALETGDA